MPIIHVVPRYDVTGDESQHTGWAVVKPDTDYVYNVTDSKSEAVEAAKGIARGQDGVVVKHTQEGEYQERRNYAPYEHDIEQRDLVYLNTSEGTKLGEISEQQWRQTKLAGLFGSCTMRQLETASNLPSKVRERSQPSA